MSTRMETPGIDRLPEVIQALREWQVDLAPVQLHPGDLGWYWRFGADATAAAVRVWARDGRVVAVGLLDGGQLLRMGVAPDVRHDEELARRVVADLDDPGRGVLAVGGAAVEARAADAICALLQERGWAPDEPWTPLHRDLREPVGDGGLRVESVTPDGESDRAADWYAVHWAAFRDTPMTQQDRRLMAERWAAMAAGAPWAEARCLLGLDQQDTPVASAIVWSAGPGRPGLLEPVGVHRDHRGRGHGRAISVAAAASLRLMGSSSAVVCTPASNVGAVAAYASAGFEQHPDVADLRRPG